MPSFLSETLKNTWVVEVKRTPRNENNVVAKATVGVLRHILQVDNVRELRIDGLNRWPSVHADYHKGHGPLLFSEKLRQLSPPLPWSELVEEWRRELVEGEEASHEAEARKNNSDYLFDDEDPHAIIEAQRRQHNEPESDDEAASESEDELLEAFEDEGGFGDNSNANRLSSRLFDAPLLRTIPDLPAPKLTVNIEPHARYDEDDSDQEFEDVPLSARPPITPDGIPSNKPVASTRGRRSKNQPRTVNLNGLQICLDENGTEIGYREAAPPKDIYAWAFDTPITEDEPYFAKGCERRMLFVSDPGTRNRQYQAHEQSFVKKTVDVEFLSAVDKAYDWNRTRRGVPGATQEIPRDGKIRQHFVLKMGAPNGPIERASYGGEGEMAQKPDPECRRP
ncbi:hypothetical protein E8E11_000930 [Didymella keratinophila]|nr:hypothetical protein E8E11_000930 [Didymella keratinophila]